MIWLMWLIFLGAPSCDSAESRLVDTAQGPVRGYKDPDESIYIFYNIPYAKAPSGSDRFKAPLPPPIWTEPLEAVDKGIICPQTDHLGFIPESKTIQEDCLIASVYVPDTEETNLPVVVYIHGGAFVIGWGDILPPKSLVKSDKIIAVSFNYRLGAHGFLCLGTKDIPGNAGMKDQVALLRWVKKNIASFGGNPEQVTLAGYSAGSASVDLLTISKAANGLFDRAILDSGSSIAAFSVQSDPLKTAKEYASLLQFDKTDDINSLEDFFKTVPYERLNSVFVMNRTDSTFLVSPCIERDLGEEVFLEDSPINILKSGNFKKMPMLYGFADMEGLFRLPFFDIWSNLMNTKFSDFLPADLKFENDLEREQVAESIRHFYFGDNKVEEKTILEFVNYFTDVIFAYSILRSAKLQVEAGNSQVYLYEYSYTDKNTPEVPHTKIRGANHCAQTFAILDGMEEVDENHAKMMRELWLNFIKTGKPTLESSNLNTWPPVGADLSPYMSLNSTLQLKDSLLKERVLFWDEIYKKYYYFPSAPSLPMEHTEL